MTIGRGVRRSKRHDWGGSQHRVVRRRRLGGSNGVYSAQEQGDEQCLAANDDVVEEMGTRFSAVVVPSPPDEKIGAAAEYPEPGHDELMFHAAEEVASEGSESDTAEDLSVVAAAFLWSRFLRGGAGIVGVELCSFLGFASYGRVTKVNFGPIQVSQVVLQFCIRPIFRWTEQEKLPSLRTITRSLRPYVMQNLCVCSRNVPVITKDSVTGDRTSAHIDYVPPLEYAVVDICTPSYWAAYHQEGIGCEGIDCTDARGGIEHGNVVRNRSWFYGQSRWISLDGDIEIPDFLFAVVGDSVSIRVLHNVNGGIIASSFFGGNCTTITGVVTGIFDIVHAGDDGEAGDSQEEPHPILDGRTEVLRTMFSRMKYVWSSPSAQRLHRPPLQPGDTVAVLRGHSTECAHRICAVFRFVAEPSDRRRFILLVSGNTMLEPSSSGALDSDDCNNFFSECTEDGDFRNDIRSIELRRGHEQRRTPGMSNVEPKTGVLQGDRPYNVYRYLLYADGFLFNRGGIHARNGSAEGFYVQPLSFGARARNMTESARIIVILTPNTDSTSFFNYLTDDIVEGMTTGREVVCPDGVTRTIFLDLVGFLGDTPGINSFLDVTGHQGNACCHRCTFHISKRRPLHNHFLHSAGDGMETAYRRTLSCRRAARLMELPPDLLQSLGLRRNPTENSFILPRLAALIRRNSRRIPLTGNGRAVVPGIFDPYCGALVAPDHLLCGLFRDYFTVSYIACFSTDKRSEFERRTRNLLHQFTTRRQNKLFDAQGKRCLNLSISDTYALSVFVPWAFAETHSIDDNTCSEQLLPLSSDSGTGLKSHLIQRAYRLLYAISSLIRVLWQTHCPYSNSDSASPPISDRHRVLMYRQSSNFLFRSVEEFCSVPEHLTTGTLAETEMYTSEMRAL